MSEEEINKTIAEYMGCLGTRTVEADYYMGEDKEVLDYPFYTYSLDACSPVMEKICGTTFTLVFIMRDKEWEAGLACWDEIKVRANSPSLALATALAKVIVELEGEK